MPGQIYGTAVIGKPIRQETEVQSGELLSITLAVPGGTLGKTFASNFRHELVGTTSMPVLPSGIAVQGSFTITVLSECQVVLTSPTDNMLPGRYEYDVRSDKAGVIDVSSLREFIVLGSITAGPGSVLPPVDSLSDLISAHNSDSTAHGGSLGGAGSNSQRFTVQPGSLVGGYAVLTHLLGPAPLDLSVFDSEGELYLPWQAIGSATVQIDFSDIVPLMQTYTVLLER